MHTFLEDIVELVLPRGDFCQFDDRLVQREMRVILVCEPGLERTANTLGTPVFLSSHRCIYTAVWRTWAACPLEPFEPLKPLEPSNPLEVVEAAQPRQQHNGTALLGVT